MNVHLIRVIVFAVISFAAVPIFAQSLASGSAAFHTLGIRSDGSVAAWGSNSFGQVSGASTVSGATQVSAGYSHSLALRSDGTVAGWGYNSQSQVSGASTVSGATAISAGRLHSLALRSNGTVAAWGFDGQSQVSGASTVVGASAISAGQYHSLALRSNGTVAAWGSNSQSQISGASAVSEAMEISAGGYHSLALRSDGTVAAWGLNNYSQVTGASTVSGATAISAGGFHSLAVRSNGTVAAWGANNQGQVSGAFGLSNVVYVGAGDVHNYAVLNNGTITSWGSPTYGQRNTTGGFALPTTVRWTSATSADYLTSHLWDGRIPSTALSTAVFDQSGSYSVGFGNTALAAGLNVNAGNVTFDLNGKGYHVVNGGNVSIASGATFTSNGGTNLSASSLTNNGTLYAGNNISAGSTLSNSGQITVASGATVSANLLNNTGSLTNNGTVSGDVIVSNTGIVSGNGSFSNNLSFFNGGTLAPGNSVGLITGMTADFNTDGVFELELNDAVGLMGNLTAGWDGLALDGSLNINADANDPFLVRLNSMGTLASNFDSSLNYSWTFVETMGGITGFDSSYFQVDSSQFLNDLSGGAFSIGSDGNDLSLNFTAVTVPEPSSFVMFGLAASIAFSRRRRACQSRKRFQEYLA